MGNEYVFFIGFHLFCSAGVVGFRPAKWGEGWCCHVRSDAKPFLRAFWDSIGYGAGGITRAGWRFFWEGMSKTRGRRDPTECSGIGWKSACRLLFLLDFNTPTHINFRHSREKAKKTTAGLPTIVIVRRGYPGYLGFISLGYYLVVI